MQFRWLAIITTCGLQIIIRLTSWIEKYMQHITSVLVVCFINKNVSKMIYI
jgi:hypothetical protein